MKVETGRKSNRVGKYDMEKGELSLRSQEIVDKRINTGQEDTWKTEENKGE